MDIFERSKMVAELSDKVAEVNRRILERSRLGQPADSSDREILDELCHQVDAARDDGEMEKAAGSSPGE